MCTYGGFVQGFVRGFDWGLGRGFVLEDHPDHWTKSQEAPGTGGSAGIPDSLGHKPACTSGAVAWSSGPVTVVSCLEFLLPWSVIVSNIFPIHLFAIRLCIARNGNLGVLAVSHVA